MFSVFPETCCSGIRNSHLCLICPSLSEPPWSSSAEQLAGDAGLCATQAGSPPVLASLPNSQLDVTGWVPQGLSGSSDGFRVAALYSSDGIDLL